MKLQKTVDGLFAAPVAAPTTGTAPGMRELEADVMANVPELAQFLDFGPNVAAAQTVGPQQGWNYSVNLGDFNTWTAGSSTK